MELTPEGQGFASGYTDEYGSPVYISAPSEPTGPVDPWDAWAQQMLDEQGAGPQFRWGDARDFGDALGVSRGDAFQWFQQGAQSNMGSPYFAGATDLNNQALVPGWGMLNIAQQSGQLTPEVLAMLQQYVDQGNQAKDAYNAMQGARSKAALGQFVGMLGGLALSPFAFGGSLGNIGGALARGAVNTLGTAIGGGNPLTAALGAAAGPLGDLADISGMFAGMDPMVAKMADAAVRSVGSGALQQLSGGQGLDVGQLALGALPGVADAAWSGAGGWDGLFGSSPGAGADSGWTSGYDLPMGGIAPVADAFQNASFSGDSGMMGGDMWLDTPTMRATTGDFAPTSDTVPELPDQILMPAPGGGYEYVNPATYVLPALNAPSIDAPRPADEPIDLAVEAVPDATPEDPQDDLFMPEEPAAEKPWYDSIKPSAILSIGMKLAALLGGGNAAVDEANAIADAEYADDTARRQAYLDYANRVFGAIPEIADAYRPEFFSEDAAMGRVEIDPETGEARYVMSPEGQKAVDDMLAAADGVINQILETDVTKLSEEEFTKKVEELKGKREADFAKLMRVLYARGMLGVATYGEAGTNLITGRTEAYDLAEGQEANPYLAAYQSGVERENTELAGKSMGDAQDFIDSLLGQSTDLTSQITNTSGNMLDAILGARGRYGARTAAGQERGNALAQLLESPAALFGDRVGAEDLLASLTRKPNLDEEERRRLLMMMEGQ